MKEVKKFEIMIFTLFLLILPVHIFAQDAAEIIRWADEHVRGKTSVAEFKMTIIRPDWSREITLKSWSKGTEYSLILITEPARDKGNTFLKRENEIWNWVPSIEKIVKIPPSMMMQSWMGSDFTNDDLVKESSIVHDYIHTLVGDSLIGDRECYKIELIPKPDAPVVWGKIYTWITKADYLQLRAEYYDEDGYLVNEMNLSNIKEMGGRLLPTRLEIIPVDKPDNKTVMEYLVIEFDKPIDDNFFSQQNMKRIR